MIELYFESVTFNFDELFDFSQLMNLTCFKCENCLPTHLIIPMLKNIKSELVSLNIAGNRININDCKELIEILNTFQSLKSLNISSCGFTPETVFNLFDVLFQLPNLTELNIGNNSIGEAFFTTLDSINYNLKWESLNIGYSIKNEELFEMICRNFSKLPHLKTLDISMDNINSFLENFYPIHR